ncbi:MAG: hypothetical protein FJ399_10930, partial [Verrucomicrobia bacterium]|nr:hypothetical protein [Verrucomicrobiota bacterium]
MRQFLLALAVCATLYVAMRHSLRIVPAHHGLASKIEGRFLENRGWYRGEPFITHRPVRAWGSWAGSDLNTGSLTLGPFPAPAHLRFAVGGYPPYPGLALRVERPGTHETIPINAPAVGERWRVIDQQIPATWRGEPIQLVALDNSKVTGGWIAITEPIRGGVGDGATGLWQSLGAWALNGLLLGVLWLAAIRLLAPSCLVPAPWLPLLGVGVVAALGHLAFWAYFAHPAAGIVVSLLILLGGGGLWFRAAAPPPAVATESAAVARLALLIGFFYLALFHLFPSSLDFYQLAANRFRTELPTDNELPHTVASRLYAGESLRQPDADWLSSDRPPLQSGWQLLTWPVLALFDVAPRPASGTAGLWLQLAWVAAVYGLLRTLQLHPRRAAAWVAVIAMGGFFLQHTTFTWPKLSAAAFACGAFALWVLPTPGVPRRSALLVGAGLAALGWLSHGGLAFSFLALAPWILWRSWRGEWRGWLAAALVFGAVSAPWLAYQKLYDPPGNRLLKWHLGGQVPKDARGTWQTIWENYAALSGGEIRAHKLKNFALQISGRWEALTELEFPEATDRRNQEFFVTSRALTWWLFGLALVPIVWRRLATAPGLRPEPARSHAALFAWVAVTIPLWCLLLFEGGQAVIHQGSYAAMLSAFVLLSAWYETAHRRWIFAVAACQAVTLISTWAPGNRFVHGDLSPIAFGFAVLGGVGLVAIVLAGARAGDSPAATPPPAAPSVAQPDAGPSYSPALDRALPWLGSTLALAPALWCARALADLWWFGDDWDLLDQIHRLGFWRWTLLPFAENFVPLFKLLWGGLVVAGGGSYTPLIAALWLTHALNTALFFRLLRAAGFGLTANGFATALFAVAAVNIETLAWSVQWSAILAITFFLLAAHRLVRSSTDRASFGWALAASLAVLSAASALSFSRGVLTGAALAVACLLPLFQPAAAWRNRWRLALACLLPAVAVAVTILMLSPGNARSLGESWYAAVQFGFCYWAATPLHRLLDSATWHWPIVIALAGVKAALVVLVFRRATPSQRLLLALLLIYDLGNAALLGIGRHHTGLRAANSERYYYVALLCTLPFLGLAFSSW